MPDYVRTWREFGDMVSRTALTLNTTYSLAHCEVSQSLRPSSLLLPRANVEDSQKFLSFKNSLGSQNSVKATILRTTTYYLKQEKDSDQDQPGEEMHRAESREVQMQSFQSSKSTLRSSGEC